MLPLSGVANNSIPHPLSAPVTFLQNDEANLPVARYHLDAPAAPSSPSSPASSYLDAPPRSLGAEGGLLSAVQNQGSNGGKIGLKISPPSSSSSRSGDLPNYPTSVKVVASGNYPSSLSSSGSLANLGIIPSKFDDSGPTGTSPPPLFKEKRPTPQVYNVDHGTYVHLLICFSYKNL